MFHQYFVCVYSLHTGLLVNYVTKTALAKLQRPLGAAAKKSSSRMERAASEQ
jgi:hypothetical protein